MIKSNFRIEILAFLGAAILGCNGQRNTFTPGEKWLDNNGVHINAHGGGILVEGDLYYWYGEHKVAGKSGNKAQVGVSCYSSKDLFNWKDEGIVLKVDETDSLSDIAKGCIIERPKVIYNKKTRKYVMWFHLELKDLGYLSARSGIAVSDKPTGPFKYVKSVRPNQGYWPINVKEVHKKPVRANVKPHYPGGPNGLKNMHVDSLNLLGRDFGKGQMARDMNLFVDDDGKAYQIYSSEENSTLHISQLSDDYMSSSGKFGRFFLGRYMEAPALFKYNDKYYLIASNCSGWKPNAARSAVADSIFGPWTELGNPCRGKDANLTFHSQGTYVLPINAAKGQFIFMGDRWVPENAIDGRYIWLPLIMDRNHNPVIEWKDEWSISGYGSEKSID